MINITTLLGGNWEQQTTQEQRSHEINYAGKLTADAFSVISLLLLMKLNKKKRLARRGFKSEINELH
jgi:hypothetical protein